MRSVLMLVATAVVAGWSTTVASRPAPAPQSESTVAAKTAPTSLPRQVALSSSLVIKVTDRDAAADALIAAAEKLGGYFTTRDDTRVVTRVPRSKAEAMQALAEKLGVVVGRSRQAVDLSLEMQQQSTLLQSRKEVLQRYFAVLRSARVDTIVEVEEEMTDLVGEIEGLQGRLKLARHQLAFAQLEVAFRFHDRRPPEATGNSSFEWINGVNLADLLLDFGHE